MKTENTVSIEPLKDLDLPQERKEEIGRIAYDILFGGVSRSEALQRSIERKMADKAEEKP